LQFDLLEDRTVPSCCGEPCSCHQDLYVLDDEAYVREADPVQFIPSFSIMGCCCSGAYYFSADNLPDGLSIDPQTGAITGTLGYDFADQANSPVTLSSTIRLHQQDLCTGETIEATGTIYWHIYDNNRLPTASSFSLENLTDSSRSSSPRTKDNLRFTVGQVSDPDGDPVFVTIEWQVNGQTVQTTSGTVSSFDLSVPGHGDVGDTITVIVKLNDGSGDFEVYSTTVTVDNTPPVVTSIIVEGAQASIYDENRGREVHYFLVGQQAVIRVYVEDDDLSPGQGNDQLRLEIFPEENLPPTVAGWTLSGYQDGYFLLTGEIAPHGNPYTDTMYYDVNICARDLYGEGDPLLTFAVTDPRFRSVDVVKVSAIPGSGTASDPYVIRSGTAATFLLRAVGVGFGAGVPIPPPRGGPATVYYSLYEDDVIIDDLLVNSAPMDINILGGPTGDWFAWHEFTLEALADGIIRGPDGSSGGGLEGDRHELYFQLWYFLPTVLVSRGRATE
jgi:hypothetical protein